MKQQHTPGPWKAVGDKIYSADRRQVAHVYALVHPKNLNVMQSIPNARLIAAAPEILEFIQKVAHWELVDYDIHEYVMEDEDVRIEAHRILHNLYNE